MFKEGDRVQFSRFGMRGLVGFVREVGLRKVLVQWRPGDLQWVRSDDLVRLPAADRTARIVERVLEGLTG